MLTRAHLTYSYFDTEYRYISISWLNIRNCMSLVYTCTFIILFPDGIGKGIWVIFYESNKRSYLISRSYMGT